MENASAVVFRLSPLQKIVWSKPELRGGFVYGRVGVDGALDVERLKSCFVRVADRHESLRTIFQVSPGFTFPFQVVKDAADFSWEVSETKPADVDGLLSHGAWPAATPVDGPTFGVKVIKVGDASHVLGLRALGLCCDSLSLRNMMAEVAQMYRDASAEEAVQYADFSEWHNEALTSETEESEAAKVLWPTETEAQVLPLVGRAVSASNGALGAYRFSIEPSVLAGVGANAEAFVLMCWQAALWRLTNQDSVIVDVIHAGRPLEDLAQSIGLFERPFPVPAKFDDKPTFAVALQRAGEGLAEMERLQAFCPVETSGKIGFVFRKLPGVMSGGAVSFAMTKTEPLHWPFALLLSCHVSDAGYAFTVLYDTAQYAENDAARIAGYFERSMRAAVAGPSADVAAFDLLDAAEREEVVTAFNSDSADYGDARAFHVLFEEQAALTPERAALVFEKTSLTYAELNAKANQIASWLRKAGVTPNAAVGLCVERSAEMIVALLGILKAGGAYVALLPDLPAARLAHQIQEAGISVVVSNEALLGVLSEFAGKVLCLDRDAKTIATEPSANLTHAVGGDDLMYVLYTSGSTGVPKGVRVRHGNVANYIYGIARRLGLKVLSAEPGLTFATVSTLGADLGNTAIFPALVTGGTLVVVSYDAAIDGGLFAEQQKAHPIDVLKITPSNLQALLAAEAIEKILPKKFLIVGGEACTWELAERVKAAGICKMLNHYGPTEATIGCLTYDVSGAANDAQAAIVPLGKPLPNVQVYVLDRELRPVPVGVPGEICISGAGIADGYIGRPDETAAKFVAHPFLAKGSALYRSGDMGRFLADGSVEFLGRVDDQVKIRGYRVELAEIEAVLHQLAGVRQSMVLLTQDSAGDSLCAYVVAPKDTSIAAMQDALRKQLPEYMVPRDFVVLDELPLNANGKVDRRKLAEMKPGAAKVQSDVVAPRNELEEQLVVIWQETLRREPIGVTENFFDLGGHSLLATQIISRVRSSLGLNVSIRMLFEAPTVESLAQAIETTRVLSGDDSDIDDLLLELEGLSDSEAEEMLSGDAAPGNGGVKRGQE